MSRYRIVKDVACEDLAGVVCHIPAGTVIEMEEVEEPTVKTKNYKECHCEDGITPAEEQRFYKQVFKTGTNGNGCLFDGLDPEKNPSMNLACPCPLHSATC